MHINAMLDTILLYGYVDVNCYILHDDTTCYIVDPGSQPERLIEFIKNEGLTPVGILLTHAHLDHIGGLHAFNVPIYMSEKDTPMLFDDEKNGFAPSRGHIPFDPASLDLQFVDEGSRIAFGGEEITVIATPGHSAGGISFLWKGMLFSGDTLFKENVGRWDLYGGNVKDLAVSIEKLVGELPPSTEVYPGHGEFTTIAHERAHNDFYKKNVR